MKYTITLVLNETGKKALGQNTKTITVDAELTDITSEYIDKIFPMSLVENFYAEKSFLDLKVGDYVCVIDENGVRHLGMVISKFSSKQLYIETYGENISRWGGNTFYFNGNGVEATRSKSKLHLEFITPEEIEAFKTQLKNQPFVEIIEMLSAGNGITYDPVKIKLPVWLSFDTVNEIKNMLEKEYNDFYD